MLLLSKQGNRSTNIEKTPLQSISIHTADADATQLHVQLSRVGGVKAPVGSRDPVYNFLCC